MAVINIIVDFKDGNDLRNDGLTAPLHSIEEAYYRLRFGYYDVSVGVAIAVAPDDLWKAIRRGDDHDA
jgi:hypothetical protein